MAKSHKMVTPLKVRNALFRYLTDLGWQPEIATSQYPREREYIKHMLHVNVNANTIPEETIIQEWMKWDRKANDRFKKIMEDLGFEHSNSYNDVRSYALGDVWVSMWRTKHHIYGEGWVPEPYFKIEISGNRKEEQ